MGANAWLRIKAGISALVLPRKVHLRLEKLPQKMGVVPPGSPTKGQFGSIWIMVLLLAVWFCIQLLLVLKKNDATGKPASFLYTGLV
jgi:hypothetical protein